MDMEMVEQGPPAVSGVKLIAGAFLAILGVVMTLDNLDVIDGSRVIRYWPVVLIVIGLVRLSDRRNRLLPVVAIGAGTLLLAARVELIHASVGELAWPLLLIIAGCGLVARSFGWSVSGVRGSSRSTIWALFSKSAEVNVSKAYEGGRVVAFMGGCELDLTDAEIANGPAVLELMTTWAAIIVRVPPAWEIVDELTPIMGAVDVRREGAGRGPALIIRGLAWMGAIEVRTGKREVE